MFKKKVLRPHTSSSVPEVPADGNREAAVISDATSRSEHVWRPTRKLKTSLQDGQSQNPLKADTAPGASDLKKASLPRKSTYGLLNRRPASGERSKVCVAAGQRQSKPKWRIVNGRCELIDYSQTSQVEE